MNTDKHRLDRVWTGGSCGGKDDDGAGRSGDGGFRRRVGGDEATAGFRPEDSSGGVLAGGGHLEQRPDDSECQFLQFLRLNMIERLGI